MSGDYVVISNARWRSLVKLRNSLWAGDIEGKEKEWADYLHIMINEASPCSPNEKCNLRKSPFSERGAKIKSEEDE
jgi:hypothetical protein